MSDPSVPQEAARAAFLKEALSLRIEEELARLYRARPKLSDRIDRASSLVVRQLSSPPRLRCIRVRVGRAGARFLVDSSTTPGATYVVDQHHLECSCPDHRREVACKHSLAAWLLWKVSLSQDFGECAACGRRRSRKRDMILLHADNHSGLDYFDGDRLCAGCADAAGVSRWSFYSN